MPPPPPPPSNCEGSSLWKCGNGLGTRLLLYYSTYLLPHWKGTPPPPPKIMIRQLV
jgi:hypothetical protein